MIPDSLAYRRTDAAVAAALARRCLTLLVRHGPMLTAIWLAGDLAQALLREAAVWIGLVSRLGGLAVVALAILTRLVVVVALFRLCAGRVATDEAPTPATAPASADFLGGLAAALVPFFLYYAAWGFLNDALRAYALAAMDADPLGASGPVLTIDWRGAALVWVGLAWMARRGAKAMEKRSALWVWPFVIVAAEAMWIFIGLFVLSHWKDAVSSWLATLPGPAELWRWAIGAAQAAQVSPPADRPDIAPAQEARGLLLYALLPVIWFNLAAIVRGYDVKANPGDRLSRSTLSAWERVPKVLRDFAAPFFVGALKRWNAVANGVRLMLSAGVPLVVLVVVLACAIDWLAGWAFFGLGQMLGPMGLPAARVVQSGLEILFGPAGWPGTGVVPEVAKIILFSAALDLIEASRPPPAPDAT